ncbi:hypothetical protein, partial [Sinorhizobium meliloti]|uniref:hypothetical protein n=1 Tax=Rhizobium meliloti TaxID=382 RepID=UPI001AECACF5
MGSLERYQKFHVERCRRVSPIPVTARTTHQHQHRRYRAAVEKNVTGRLLPRRFRLDASDDFFVVDEAVEEVVPGFR